MEHWILFIIGAVIALISIAVVARMRTPGGMSGHELGWMSEQWLAEHRASHSA